MRYFKCYARIYVIMKLLRTDALSTNFITETTVIPRKIFMKNIFFELPNPRNFQRDKTKFENQLETRNRKGTENNHELKFNTKTFLFRFISI